MVLGAEVLGDDPRFKTNAERMKNRGELEEVLAGYFKTATTDEWIEALEAASVPAGPVLSIAEMHQDPQTLAREMVVEVDHPVAGSVKTIGAPVKFHETPGGIHRPAPLFGEHTKEVLLEFGFSDSEVAAMIDDGSAIETKGT